MRMIAGMLLAAPLCATVWAVQVSVAEAQGRSEAMLSSLERTPHAPTQVLVQFRYGVSEEGKTLVRERARAHAEEVVVAQARRSDMKGDLELWNLPPGLGIARAVRELERDAAIEFAEPNWIYHHQASSNDPYYTNGSLWGMYGDGTSPSNPFGSQAGEAWAYKSDCSGTYVGIIDQGMMFTHEDLAANAWTNPFDPLDGIDNDGNGYIDDIHGWDFVGNDNDVFDGASDYHGTHVSGTVAANGGNGNGVVGVCWKASLISLKFLSRTSGTLANAIKAVDYATDLKSRHGLNVVATNNSWGGGGYSIGLYDAIERANRADILFVAGAGNSGGNNDSSPFYPASYSNTNIISVAAIDQSGNLPSWSNYGSVSVDLGAPGVGVWSTIPLRNRQSGYGNYDGTSMATPHVTGAAALYAAAHPAATAASIKAAILSSAASTGSLSGKTVTGGRLNISAALCSPSCP